MPIMLLIIACLCNIGRLNYQTCILPVVIPNTIQLSAEFDRQKISRTSTVDELSSLHCFKRKTSTTMSLSRAFLGISV